MKSIIARIFGNKERGRLVLKVFIGGLLVYYVLQGKMVDFSSLQSVLFNPFNLLVSILILIFASFCCAVRWYLLARAQQLNLSLKGVFKLVMIGNFFNTFMPGAVGGDLIKAWYVAGEEPKRKTKAVFTVLLDRVVGLAVILFYSAVTLLIYFGWVRERPELLMMSYTVWAVTGLIFLFGVLFFWDVLWRFKLVHSILNFLHRFGPLSKIIDAGLLYRKHLRTLLLALVLSAINIFSIISLFMIQGASLGIDMELSKYFMVVPIGITVSAIPLLPGGIGVGQVAFFKLFQWLGASNPELGGTLCTLMQVYVMMFNCIGAVFYLKYKRRPKEIPETLSSIDTSPANS